jgi:hypothetical protein
VVRDNAMEVRDMHFLSEAHHFQQGDPLTDSGKDDIEEVSTDDSPIESIPQRYRDGSGGIDLDQVRQDQLRARRQVVQAMLRRLKNLRRR